MTGRSGCDLLGKIKQSIKTKTLFHSFYMRQRNLMIPKMVVPSSLTILQWREEICYKMVLQYSCLCFPHCSFDPKFFLLNWRLLHFVKALCELLFNLWKPVWKVLNGKNRFFRLTLDSRLRRIRLTSMMKSVP